MTDEGTGIEREPMTVQSRGRLYTTEQHRDDIQASSEQYGKGTPVTVELLSVDRSRDWGVYAETAVFTDSLGYYGEVSIPPEVRDELELDVGDSVRVTITR
jgi:hypothetical protein